MNSAPMNLVELATGVFAFIDPAPRFGRSNVGLVIDGDGLTIFDTTATPSSGERVRQQVLELTSALELPIRRVVLSSSRIPLSGGGQPFYATAGGKNPSGLQAAVDAAVSLLKES